MTLWGEPSNLGTSLLPEPTEIVRSALDPNIPDVEFGLYVFTLSDLTLLSTDIAAVSYMIKKTGATATSVPGFIHIPFIEQLAAGDVIGVDLAVERIRIKNMVLGVIARQEQNP